MGFEQLAALKRELVAQAEQEKRKARKPSQNGRKTPRKPTQESPVDPVVITISRLQKQFPQAFPKKPAAKLPLKLGIHKDLYEQAETLKLTNAEIKEAVKTWCQGSRYWACMTEGAARLDLNGEPAGEVTAADAQHAKQLANRRRAHAIRSRKQEADKANTGEAAADETSTAAASPDSAPATPESPAAPDSADQAANTP
ncbi:ProQ/FinO family protein [Pusillimonas sp. MFBS29]|uniref:ProQ/FinO family protein n=1 Tax=Pusillimonas sp. MFBS29 TaxID=2886690 RepID=UPI001D12F430|nr:ProQ/FinO family protein [Pusillimonas sp. MFBS29]MCC2596524.1 ProQ/FinO family protein [Pusillimonas sp. MFBS29]